MMSTRCHLVLRQTSLLYRIQRDTLARQTCHPFSTSLQRRADPTNNDSSSPPPKAADYGGKSFDSVPVHLGPFGRIIMVLGGLYSRLSDVPESVPNRVYQKTKDKFRARCVVVSLFGTALLAFVASIRGKIDSKKGKRFTDEVFEMHRGESRVHGQLEAVRNARRASERYSPPVDEVNK